MDKQAMINTKAFEDLIRIYYFNNFYRNKLVNFCFIYNKISLSFKKKFHKIFEAHFPAFYAKNKTANKSP